MKFTIQDLNLNDVSLADILTYEKDLIKSVMKKKCIAFDSVTQFGTHLIKIYRS